MSLKLINGEITRFLTIDEPEVLVIKGKWGVGKTYTFETELKKLAGSKKLGLKRYSYVSLFGVKDVNDLKFATFENTASENEILSGVNERTLRAGLGLIAQLPIVTSNLGNLEKIVFAGVRDQIVCFDDLERHSKDININDILGLVSFLKNQRGCKVILLLNEEMFCEDDKTVFKNQLEKVADLVMELKPTPVEAATLIFPNHSGGINKFLYGHCITLGIVNLRVIKKIEKNAKKIEKILGAKSPLLNQAINSVVLYTWITLQPEEAPTFDFLSDTSRIYGFVDSKKQSDTDKSWVSLLREYGYNNTDDFDKVLYENIKLGYFNKSTITEEAERQLKVIGNQKLQNAYQKAWEVYHDSFDDNGEEFLTGIYKAAKDYIKNISVNELDSAICMLRELSKQKEANELVSLFVRERAGDEDAFDIEHIRFMHDVRDAKFLEALQAGEKLITKEKDPTTILNRVALDRGWNPKDIIILNRMQVNDFYTLFKNAKGNHKHQIIRVCLQFAKTNPTTEEMISITKKAEKALAKIAAESKINEKRIFGYYGISPIKKPQKKKK